MFRKELINGELVLDRRGFFGLFWFFWRNLDREVSYLRDKEAKMYEKYKAAKMQRVVAETNVKEDKRSMQSMLLSESNVEFYSPSDIDILSSRTNVKYDFSEKSDSASNDGKAKEDKGKSGGKGNAVPIGSLKVKGKDGKEINLGALKVFEA